MGLPSDQTRKVLVVILLYSCLPLFRLVHSQLIRSMNADTCDNRICPGDDVQYDCSVPIHGSVVVWRMLPECERNGEQPDITFLFGDPLLSIVCNDGRKVEVQGMTTSDGSRFVSTLNITNITSSQTTECLFDDGSEEETIGNNTVFTTAPARSVVNEKDAVLTLDQAIENCTLIDYAVNTSTDCGMCGIVAENTVTCTNVLVGSVCTVEIETRLCGILVNIGSHNISTTSSITQKEDSLSGGEIAAIVICMIFLLILVTGCIILVVVLLRKQKKEPTDEQGENLRPLDHSDNELNPRHWLDYDISREQAESILKEQDINDGIFLVRKSESSPGNYSISVRVDNEVHHHLVYYDRGKYFHTTDVKFDSLDDLIDHYCVAPLFPEVAPSFLLIKMINELNKHKKKCRELEEQLRNQESS